MFLPAGIRSTQPEGDRLALFGKKKGSDDGNNGDDSSGGSDFNRDPRKARRFFEHAKTVAEATNYDYAIEMYINGLRHDPDNMPMHEALLDVAKRRKVAGGKPMGMMDKLKSSGSDAVSKMLDAEKTWAMNFTDGSLMKEFMKRAVEADEAEAELNLGEIAFWIGSMAMEFMGPKAKSKDYIAIRDLFARVGSYDKAIEACKRAIRLDMNNSNLMADLKNLEAEKYAAKSAGSGEADASFRDNIKDEEFSKESASGNTRAVSAVDAAVAKRRAEYEEDPEDLDRLSKLVDALLKKEEYNAEEEAMKLLGKAHQQTGQYRYKVRVGDIKMKQFNRDLRDIKKNLAAAPSDDYFKQRFKDAQKDKLTFELGEYAERVKNYPTDLKLKFELGKRYYQSRQFDEAIGMLQQGKDEPKSRAQAHLLLGRCFIEKEWFDEAVDTVHRGIEAHPIPDDAVGKELRYDLMISLLAAAEKSRNVEQADEANKLASELLQMDINYKDIKDRKQQATELLNTLRNAG